MNPVLEAKIDYAQKNLGMGKGAVAKLYKDKIEVVDRAGDTVATIKLKDITAASYASGLIRLKVGEQKHILTFFYMPYRLFGLLGLFLSGAMKNSKVWFKQLQDFGVPVQKKKF